MNKKQINNILIWFSAIILIILIMTPGLWVVLTAFRPQVDVMAKPAVWTVSYTHLTLPTNSGV